MRKNLFVFFNLLLLVVTASLSENTKFDKWQQPSFFRGINIYAELKLQDFIDLRNNNCKFVQLSLVGFNDLLPPYAENSKNVAVLDSLTSYCRQNEIYYTISVRQGPGRKDVYLEGIGQKPYSTIWKNEEEQKLYAGMLKRMVLRYKYDSLFVGICPILEPNPLFDTINYINSKMFKDRLIINGIDMAAINKLMIDSIREADSEIPILLQNICYSNPEFYDIMDKQTDNYCVYEFHSYRPSEYVNASKPDSLSYPGKYVSILDLAFKTYDKAFMDTTLFKNVKSFQTNNHVPVFLGEFGLLYQQKGGCQFLKDMYDIAKENNWHYAIWDYRTGRGGGAWDYEKKGEDYWSVVRESFGLPTGIPIDNGGTGYKAFHVYPNVTNSIIMVIINDFSSEIKLKLYDLLGNIAGDFTGSVKGQITTIDLSDMKEGAYFLKLEKRSNVETVMIFIRK